MSALKEILKPTLYRNPLCIGALRNRPCPCGSGKKIKQCHGQTYAIPLDQAKAINELITKSNRKPENLKEV